ncbi:hypothetical protein, partial [Pseudomonas sp. Root9]|uniref:hypothetical protein n=1 Tax=Pseudomonas sp. Root9 TaxID=1736604 RepID=UPI001F47C821
NRHPCRFTPQIPVEFRPAWFDGALKIKIKSRSRSRAARFASWLAVGRKSIALVLKDKGAFSSIPLVFVRVTVISTSLASHKEL